MVIRSYTADSVANALKQVRAEMGADAVVLKTRTVEDVTGGRIYEVTACLDKPTAAQADRVLTGTAVEEPAAPNPRVALDDIVAAEKSDTPRRSEPTITDDQHVSHERLARIERQLEALMQASGIELTEPKTEPTVAERITKTLRNSDVPSAIIVSWLEAISESSDDEITFDEIRRFVADKTESLIDTGFDFRPGDRVLVTGLPGAGKTSVVGRLAAHLILEKKFPVRLLSFDNAKVGAHDEIASYADLLGVSAPKVSASDAEENRRTDKDKIVLIDTGALPTDDDRRHEFEQKIERYKPTHRLIVFSALTRSVEIEAVARTLDWLKPSQLVMTHADLTDRFGGLYAAAETLEVKLVMLTDSPNSSGAWPRPDAKKLASGLLKETDGE